MTLKEVKCMTCKHYRIPSDWYKVRGRAVITDGVNEELREIHWYQADNIGKVEFKFPSNKKQR